MLILLENQSNHFRVRLGLTIIKSTIFFIELKISGNTTNTFCKEVLNRMFRTGDDVDIPSRDLNYYLFSWYRNILEFIYSVNELDHTKVLI